MRRRFPILLLIYVTLDFGNPLMPGAVSFDAGAIQVVQGDRTTRAARTAAAPARLVAAAPAWSVVALAATSTRSAPTYVPGRSSVVRPACRSSLLRCTTPSPSSSEDH